MNDFSGIWLSLDIHRDKINKLIAEFKETDKKNRETYSEAYYKEEHGKLVARYQKRIADEKESVSDNINTRFWNIQNVLDKCNLRRAAATGAFASGHSAEHNGHPY